MPRRKQGPKEAVEKRIDYEFLLRAVNRVIEAKFGSVTQFLSSPEFKATGFKESERQKVYTYLSLPRDGGEKQVKSVPVMARLASKLLGIELEPHIEVKRTQVILSSHTQEEIEALIPEPAEKENDG